MRWISWLIGLVIIVVGQPAAAQTARDLLERMTLVPAGPGGSLALQPIYFADTLPAPQFKVFIKNTIGAEGVDEYLRQRAVLLTAQYKLRLFEFPQGVTDPAMTPPGPGLEIGTDASGQLSFQGVPLTAGSTYAWQVVAAMRNAGGDTVELSSCLLYFRLAPIEDWIPKLLSTSEKQMLADLLSTTALQLRGSVAMGIVLDGQPVFVNLPSASDAYFCMPTSDVMISPWPGASAFQFVANHRIAVYGAAMRQALVLREQLHAGAEVTAQLAQFAFDLNAALLVDRQQAQRLTAVQDEQVLRVSDLATQLAAVEAETTIAAELALLSSLILAIDELVDSGSLDLNRNYEQAFLVYAAETSRRLERWTDQQDLFEQYLGPVDAGRWLTWIRDQRAELALLTDEVERGRLSKAQLAARLGEAALKPTPAVPTELRWLVDGTCLVHAERIKRIDTGTDQQIRELAGQLLLRHLELLGSVLWPPAEPGA